jgi:hypothetical protein
VLRIGVVIIGVFAATLLRVGLATSESDDPDARGHMRAAREFAKVTGWLATAAGVPLIIGGLVSRQCSPGVAWTTTVAGSIAAVAVLAVAQQRYQSIRPDLAFWAEEARVGRSGQAHGRRALVEVLAFAVVVLGAALILR